MNHKEILTTLDAKVMVLIEKGYRNEAARLIHAITTVASVLHNLEAIVGEK